jgi:hypothetical protein
MPDGGRVRVGVIKLLWDNEYLFPPPAGEGEIEAELIKDKSGTQY